LCYRNYKPEVGFGQLFKRNRIPFPYSLCQFYLFIRSDQSYLSYFLQILVQRLTFPIGNLLADLKLSHRVLYLINKINVWYRTCVQKQQKGKFYLRKIWLLFPSNEAIQKDRCRKAFDFQILNI